jgi:ribonuclease HII
MIEFDKQYPKYGFSSHKGYGTKDHKGAILKYGPTPIHRITFKGVVS